MDCDCKDKYVGRSLNGSTSSFHDDDQKMNAVPNTSTSQNTVFSDEKDLECTSMCLKDSKLSLTDDHSGKENFLFSSLATSNPLAFDLEVSIQNAPVERQRPFQNSSGRDICSSDGVPICTQLPANHLKHSHSTVYKTTHRHRGTRRFSTSTSKSRQSLKPPGEDLCASCLLACLFCKFWDCILTVGDGCQYCVASICSSICSTACCCDPSTLDVFMDFCSCCSCTEYMEACGCCCGESAFDCSICDLCLQTTECLELGMELSQILFH